MKLIRLSFLTAILVLVSWTTPVLAHIKRGTFEIEGGAEGTVTFSFDTDDVTQGTISFNTSEFGMFEFDITQVEFDPNEKWKITRMEFTETVINGTINFTTDPPEGTIDAGGMGGMFTIKKDEQGNLILNIEKVVPEEKARDEERAQQGNSNDSSSLNFVTPDSLSFEIAPIDSIFLNNQIPSTDDPLLGGEVKIGNTSILAPANNNSGWFLGSTNYQIFVNNTEVLSAELVNVFLFNKQGDPMFDSEIQAEFRNININNVINSPYLALIQNEIDNNLPRHLSVFSNILSATNNLTLSNSSSAKIWEDGSILSTPEPSSTLPLLILGTLGAGSALKHKLKQQSTEKKAEKVG